MARLREPEGTGSSERVKSECRALIRGGYCPGRDVDGEVRVRRWFLGFGLFLLGWLSPWSASVSGAVGGGSQWEDPEGRWLIQNWQTEDGLPENSATSVVQDSDGFLWFGTFKGLVRFDGVSFTVFNRANTPELPDDGIVNLHRDGKGQLWISTLRGVVVRGREGWLQIRQENGDQLSPVRSFSERPNGDLLLTLFDGPIHQWVSNRLARLPAPPGREGRGYLGMVDGDGAWWAVQSGFVGRWQAGQWCPVVDSDSLAELGGDQVACAVGLRGDHWILLGQDLMQFRGQSLLGRRRLDKDPGSLWSMTFDGSGRLWICSYVQGLMEVDESGRTREWQAPAMLPSNSLRVVYEDRESNLWIGASGGGLTRIKRRRVEAFGVGKGMLDRSAASVSPAPDGKIWVGSFGQGLMELDPVHRSFQTDPEWRVLSRYVQCVQVDRTGQVWASVFNRGVWKSDGRLFVPLPWHPDVSTNVMALFEDRRGDLWVAGATGAGIIRGGVLRPLGKDSGLPLGNVRGFGEDGSGAIWVAHDEGVFRFERDRFPGALVLSEAGEPMQRVNCFQPDDRGGMWMGTSDDGLLHWRDGTVRRIEMTEDPRDVSIHGMVDDQRGCLWLGSSRGILRVRHADLADYLEGRSSSVPSVRLDRSDGMPGAEVPAGRQPVCGRDRDGRIWFATSRGVAALRPDPFPINRVVPRTFIEEVVCEVPGGSDRSEAFELGQAVLERLAGPFPADLKLPEGTRFVEIRFTAPSLVAPEKVRFQIRLDQDGLGWRGVGTRRTVHFEGLNPGWHEFQVRACNEDGVWDEVGARVRFHMPARFWQTTAFQVLVGSAVVAEAGLIMGLVWNQRRRRRAEMEVQVQRLELSHLSRVMSVGELASSLAHELNHPQSAILSNAQAGELFLTAQPPAFDEVRRILSDIVRDTRRANGIIQRLRAFLQKRELELEAVDLEALVRETLVLVEADARARQVTVSLDPPGPLPRARADRIHLQQVLLNLILNALDALESVPAGTAARQVVVTIGRLDLGTLEIRVRDTGPGIPADKLARVFEPFFTTKPKGMGLGLSLARTLVETQGGRIHAENAADRGAVLSFTLPVAEPPSRHE